MTLNFTFLQADFPAIYETMRSAERQAGSDPTAAAFLAGKGMELAVKWAFAHDPGLTPPFQDTISTLIHDPDFRRLAGEPIHLKCKYINRIRNRAVHEEKRVSPSEVTGAIKELFHVAYWFGRTYGRTEKPADGLTFDPTGLTARDDAVKMALAKLKQQQAALEAKDQALEDLRSGKADLDEELQALRREVAAARAAAAAIPDPHDYNEAETRDRFIDLLLREAGWQDFVDGRDTEYRVTPMPNTKGFGFADYVLWGADGLPLAVVEAKRTRIDAREGQQQAKLYADALEAMHGRRPVIFYTNGYQHWIWDDAAGRPPRALGGFLKRDELELMIQRRKTRKPLLSMMPDTDIAARPYQLKAIGRVAQDFDEGRNKALLVMATGTGKTRTVISLVDTMMRAGWVKRVLFLADRVSLVKQAVGAFKTHLPSSNPVNLVTDKTGTGRVYVSTYPTMMGLIDGKVKKDEAERSFGPGHFDLVVIDEAHRSVYRRYRAIFEYFDSFLVGLTATPRDEVDRDTYSLFDLEPGVPTDSYDLDVAIKEGWLVPPEPLSVPTKFLRGGIKYDDLPEDEKDQWDMLDWEDDDPPDEVSSEELNKYLFNEDTVDKVLGHLMINGIRVEGGEKLGKTIIFAKNQKHAEFIERRFNAGWPHLAGHFARIITHKVGYAQNLIDDFSIVAKDPQIAISVDMLDTGIDVPEVVNLVFFKLIRSKTKFWQMVGRGTRLSPDLFGPGLDKDAFRIFDFCQNLEYFGQDPPTKDAKNAKSLTERLFDARLDLIRTIETEVASGGMADPAADFEDHPDAKPRPSAIAADARKTLQDIVMAMSLDNFVVRTERQLVERYQDESAWVAITEETVEELGKIAGLPSSASMGSEDAKRFDLLIFSLQLAVLKGSKRFEKLKQQLVEIAALLETKTNIPAIARHGALLQDIQSDPWWDGIDVPSLELVRLRLRDVVHLIEKASRTILYSNFEDESGAGVAVDLPKTSSVDTRSFKRKARAFLRDHEGSIALVKVRSAKPLTPTDLDTLEAMLASAGIGMDDDMETARATADGFAGFIRSLVGLDRKAAETAFSDFLSDGARPDQIEFIGMIVDHLTENGSMEPGLLYESPFKDIAPSGPDSLFSGENVTRIVETIETVSNVVIDAEAS